MVFKLKVLGCSVAGSWVWGFRAMSFRPMAHTVNIDPPCSTYPTP